MNRDAKRISSNFNREVSNIVSYIKSSNGGGFDGCGYPFKKALSQCRKEGLVIKYFADKCHYKLITLTKN